MQIPTVEAQQARDAAALLTELPHLWIGYLIGLATMVAELVDAGQPATKLPGTVFVIAPLYVFLPAFIGLVYWLVCVHRFHSVLASVPGWKHPISPGRAAGFHLIPLYNFYWPFKWSGEIAKFVNIRLGRRFMRARTVGLTILGAFVVRFLDPGFGLILLFVAASYVSACLRHALLASPRPTADET
ncbi:MAG TPA: hypothetical protein VJP87_01255 [Candidatus Acidoferrales bacterium]|nr:hypothetical protein [Candidatus Acidoferrales bacterium]